MCATSTEELDKSNRWMTGDEVLGSSTPSSTPSISSGVRSCGSSRPAGTHAGRWGVGCGVPRFLPRGAPCARDSRTGHEGGQRRRASPSRAPHYACARAHAATQAGTGAGGGGSRVVSGVAGCAQGGGRRARGTRASRQHGRACLPRTQSCRKIKSSSLYSYMEAQSPDPFQAQSSVVEHQSFTVVLHRSGDAGDARGVSFVD